MTEAINRALADGAVERPGSSSVPYERNLDFFLSDASGAAGLDRRPAFRATARAAGEARERLRTLPDALGGLDELPSEFCSLVHEILAFHRSLTPWPTSTSVTGRPAEMMRSTLGSRIKPRASPWARWRARPRFASIVLPSSKCTMPGLGHARRVGRHRSQCPRGLHAVDHRRPQNSTADGVEHTPEPTRIPFQAIGRYRFLRELGVGGFGSVYLALDEQLKRLVAIKIPRTHVTASRGSMERFSREYRHAAQLRPIPTSSPCTTWGSTSGRSLPRLRIRRRSDAEGDRPRARRLDRREAATLVAEVARALDYAHSHGVTHRDVKSLNVMIDRSGHAH